MWKENPEQEIGVRPNWDEFFMALTITYSSRSSCRNVRAASILVEDKNIAGIGYNGAPTQIPSCYEIGCSKEKLGLKYEDSLNSGTCIGIHAEMNAIGNLTKRNVKGLELYTTIFPCHDCAKNLLPYHLERVIFKNIYSDKELKSTLDLFSRAGVSVEKLNLSPERFIDIIFNFFVDFERKFDVWSPEEKKRLSSLVSQPTH